jgi:hypothetical protein
MIASGLGGVEIIHFYENNLKIVDFVSGHTMNCHQLVLYNPELKPAGSRQDPIFALGGLDFQVTLWDADDLICHTTISLE